MSDLSVTGAAAGQAVSDTATLQPFAALAVSSTAAAIPDVTAVVTLSATQDGALSHLGVGALSADGATYTVSRSPALVPEPTPTRRARASPSPSPTTSRSTPR